MTLRLLLCVVALLPALAACIGVAFWSFRTQKAQNPDLGVLAAAFTALLALFVRFGASLSLWPGAQTWFATSALPTDNTAAFLALALALLQNTVFALVLALWAAIGSRPRATQTARAFRLALGGALLLSSLGLLSIGPLVLEPVLDVAVFGPLAGLALLFSGLPFWEKTELPVAPTKPDSAPSQDAEQVLRRLGLLTGQPDFVFPTTTSNPRSVAPQSAVLQTLWTASGGVSLPPAGLPRFLSALQSPEPQPHGLWMGQLPPQSLWTVTTCFLGAAVLSQGARVLVISRKPETDHAQFSRLLSRVGHSRSGATVLGPGQLVEQLAVGLFPSLVFLEVEDLAGEALRHLTRLNPAWFAALDAVLLVRVDGLAPIPSTHLALSLRRLVLASQNRLGEGRSLRFFALSSGSESGRHYLEQALLRTFETIELGPYQTAAAHVFLRRGSVKDEPEKLGAALHAEGIAVQMEDPLGELQSLASSFPVHDSMGYHGEASVAVCDERSLAQLFGAGPSIVHTEKKQLSLVYCKDSPLCRFLTDKGVLAGLSERGELPTRRPLAGTNNDFLLAAHLEAALFEGEPAEWNVRQAFLDAPVDSLLNAGTTVKQTGVRASFLPGEHRIVRSPKLHRSGAALSPERLQTVTQNVLDVRREHDRALLFRTDRRLAKTRFYPHRVFAHEGKLYEVLAGALGNDTTVFCALLRTNAVPTMPLLDLRAVPSELRSSVDRHQFGKLTFARAVASVTVEETVSGSIPRGESEPKVRYPAVESRYPSHAVLVLFESVPSHAALRQLACGLDWILPAHVVHEDEDAHVLACPEGFSGLSRPALLFVDRHLGGLGLADALTAEAIYKLLRWTWGVLYRCPCMNGCAQCVPAIALAQGADKQGVLKLLGG